MTDWSQYVFYECRHYQCQENCINRVDSPATRTKQCWGCYHEHDPDELSSLTHHLPDEPLSLQDATTESQTALADTEPVESTHNR